MQAFEQFEKKEMTSLVFCTLIRPLLAVHFDRTRHEHRKKHTE